MTCRQCGGLLHEVQLTDGSWSEWVWKCLLCGRIAEKEASEMAESFGRCQKKIARGTCKGNAVDESGHCSKHGGVPSGKGRRSISCSDDSTESSDPMLAKIEAEIDREREIIAEHRRRLEGLEAAHKQLKAVWEA